MSVFKIKAYAKQNTCILLRLHFDPEVGGSIFVQHIGEPLPDYTVSHPRRHMLFAVNTVTTLNPSDYLTLHKMHILISPG
jgi:hypothetical protein